MPRDTPDHLDWPRVLSLQKTTNQEQPEWPKMPDLPAEDPTAHTVEDCPGAKLSVQSNKDPAKDWGTAHKDLADDWGYRESNKISPWAHPEPCSWSSHTSSTSCLWQCLDTNISSVQSNSLQSNRGTPPTLHFMQECRMIGLGLPEALQGKPGFKYIYIYIYI